MLMNEVKLVKPKTDLLFVFLLHTVTSDENKRLAFRQRIGEYMSRAEKLKNHVEKEKECMYILTVQKFTVGIWGWLVISFLFLIHQSVSAPFHVICIS